MEKGQESKQKRKTPLTTIAISQEYAKKLDEYLNGTGITRKEFVELSVDYFQRTGFDLRGEAFDLCTYKKQKEGIVIIPPFGYFKDKNTRQVVIVEEAADTVRLIFKLYLDGYGFKQIAKKLNADGVHTPPDVYKRQVFSIPLGIFHFSVAGRYFEEGYLQRLKKRTETSFAVAAHDCFNSSDFWTMMEQLPMAGIEAFTVSPAISSSYTFARSPRDEKEMVFVQRISFPSPIHFYSFDLMNGLHHAHAPSQCRNCGKYFLTTNGRIPKYCSGNAPQDAGMTCRQYGAMMRQKEQNREHPIYRLFSTRTNTIRKHHQRGKISDDLRRESLRLAEICRDKALMDNGYAAAGYARDMEQERLYAEARKRVAP